MFGTKLRKHLPIAEGGRPDGGERESLNASSVVNDNRVTTEPGGGFPPPVITLPWSTLSRGNPDDPRWVGAAVARLEDLVLTARSNSCGPRWEIYRGDLLLVCVDGYPGETIRSACVAAEARARAILDDELRRLNRLRLRTIEEHLVRTLPVVKDESEAGAMRDVLSDVRGAE